MARKPLLDGTPLPEDPPETGHAPGGFWGGSMSNMLRAELAEARARLDALSAAATRGLAVVAIPSDRIDDAVGSDRTAGWEDDPEFAALVDDIARRGQTTPVRVRPADPAWTPGPGGPSDPGEGRFLLQSGRRRVAACRRLGRAVLALVATPEGEAEMADLEERFLENRMRKALSGFEELVSIGVIARRWPDLGQREIARRLGVPHPDVSLGLACLDLGPVIMERVDVAATPKRAYRDLIPRLRAEAEGAAEVPRWTEPGRAPAPPPIDDPADEELAYRGFRARVAVGPRSARLVIRGYRGAPQDLRARLEAFLAELDGDG
jgi:ParB-like chromosome segregation protein Spo0J